MINNKIKEYIEYIQNACKIYQTFINQLYEAHLPDISRIKDIVIVNTSKDTWGTLLEPAIKTKKQEFNIPDTLINAIGTLNISVTNAREIKQKVLVDLIIDGKTLSVYVGEIYTAYDNKFKEVSNQALNDYYVVIKQIIDDTLQNMSATNDLDPQKVKINKIKTFIDSIATPQKTKGEIDSIIAEIVKQLETAPPAPDPSGSASGGAEYRGKIRRYSAKIRDYLSNLDPERIRTFGDYYRYNQIYHMLNQYLEQ
jgi:hypothetical protein